MATPLALPAHADILEFSVMYTRSVRKKTKDWHDGYLKWHTFNYRAILYDDQRKAVANEFFPNRTINANSDFEFSSAIVQVGDQLGTLQANLEHIYRSPHPPARADLERSAGRQGQSSAVVSRHPQPVSTSRSGPKRVYPQSASKSSWSPASNVLPSMVTKASTVPYQDSPLRAASARRSIGMARPQQSGKSLQSSILLPPSRPQGSLLNMHKGVQEPGWLAREDKMAAEAVAKNSDITSTETNLSRRPAANHRPVAKGKDASTATRQRGQPLQTKAVVPTSPKSDVIEITSNSPADTGTYSELDRESGKPEDSTSGKISLLDPTRKPLKRKSRTMLAATKKCPSSATIVSKTRLDGEVAQQSLSIRHHGSQAVPAKDAIYDADASKWVAEHDCDRSREVRRHESFNTFEDDDDEAIAHCDQAISIHSSPISDMDTVVSEVEACIRSKVNDPHDSIEESRELSSQSTYPTGFIDEPRLEDQVLPHFNPMERKVYETDEDGFLIHAPECRRKPLEIINPSSVAKRRKLHHTKFLIEQYKITDDEPHVYEGIFSNEEDGSVIDKVEDTTRRVSSNLFVPDDTTSSQESSDDDPGVFTQIRARAAKEIATRSSLNRIGPAARINRLNPPLKLLKTTLFKKDTVVKPNVHITGTEKSVSPPPKNVYLLEDDNESFPATPANLETHDLDAIFDDDDDTHSFSTLAVSTTTTTTNGGTGNDQAACRGEEYKLATQINQRAPDFMTAKSYNSGAILNLDRPLPSVGMSIRDLSNLDSAVVLE